MRNNSLNWALLQASRKLSVNLKIIEAVYKSYWKFIKTHASNLSIDTISEEELASTITNFNIPYIGKLYVSYDKIQKHRNQLKYYKTHVKAKENKTNRKSDPS